MDIGLGSFLRAERRAHKLTLRELSEKTGIDYSMICKYENGVVVPPRPKLQLIASALNISEDALLSYEQVGEMDLPIRRRSTFMSVDDDLLMVSESTAGQMAVNAAHGKCELCGQVFPDGDSFLEAHFLKWLSNGGSPTIDNVVALCPNCHKRIHLYNDPLDIELLQRTAKSHMNN